MIRWFIISRKVIREAAMLNNKQTEKLVAYTEKVRQYVSVFIKAEILADPSLAVFYNKSKYHAYTYPAFKNHHGEIAPISLGDYLARFPYKQQDEFKFNLNYYIFPLDEKLKFKLRLKYIHQDVSNKLELFKRLVPIVAERFRKDLANDKKVKNSDLKEFAQTLVKGKRLKFSAEISLAPQFDESGNIQYFFVYTIVEEYKDRSLTRGLLKQNLIYFNVIVVIDNNLNMLIQSPNNWLYFLPIFLIEAVSSYLDDPALPTTKLPSELRWAPTTPLIQQNSKHLLYSAAHLHQTSEGQKIVMSFVEKQSVLALLNKIQKHKQKLFSEKAEDKVIQALSGHMLIDDADEKDEKNKKPTLQLTVDKRALTKSLQTLFKLPKKVLRLAPEEKLELLRLRK